MKALKSRRVRSTASSVHHRLEEDKRTQAVLAGPESDGPPVRPEEAKHRNEEFRPSLAPEEGERQRKR